MDQDRLNQLTSAMGQKPKKAVRGVLYSDSGHGKTHLMMEIADRITPEGKAWLLIDTSDNWMIRDQINNGEGPKKPNTFLPFTFIEDLELIAEAIVNKIPPYDMVGTIILDEASKMAEADIDRIFLTRRPLVEDADMIETPDWGDYRPAMIRFRKMLQTLIDVPELHILLVAHEKGPVKDLKKQHASFPIATYNNIKRKMSFVGRLTAEDQAGLGEQETSYVREIQINPTKVNDAKSRLGTGYIKMPSEWFPDLVVKWLGSDQVYEEIKEDQPEDTETIEPEDQILEPDFTVEDVNFDDFKTN